MAMPAVRDFMEEVGIFGLSKAPPNLWDNGAFLHMLRGWKIGGDWKESPIGEVYANKNSFVLNSLIVSLSLAAFSNSKRLAASRMSLSSLAT